MPLNREQVQAALRGVQDPELYKDVVTLGYVKEIAVDPATSAASVRLELPQANVGVQQQLDRGVREQLARLGVVRPTVSVTARGAAATPGGPVPAGASRGPLPQVEHVIAVGAGKGGVGKSTMALNLAIALQRRGLRVGLMDGDIYGPSMPTMLGVKGQQLATQGNRITPLFAHGLHAITMGSLVPEDKPLIWRGPMAHGAFKQLLLDHTIWPTLDYLIVDLPPGTGDIPLSLCQMLPLTGAVIVATPQQVAIDDAVRAAHMFEQLGTAVLGVVENMSCFIAPDGTEHDIFGRGGAKRMSEQLNVPFLGAIPMFPELRVNGDAGTPRKNFEGDPKLRAALEAASAALLEQVAKRDAKPEGPTLTIS